jgi:hypothetical protein
MEIEEQRMMFDQVRFVPIIIPALPEAVACRAVTSIHKPTYPEHIDQMMKSPFKADFKGVHFKNYDNIYSTGTRSFPVLCLMIPDVTVILPICPAYAVKSTSAESTRELQIRSCANVARMIQDINYDESFSPMAMIDRIRVLFVWLMLKESSICS